MQHPNGSGKTGYLAGLIVLLLSLFCTTAFGERLHIYTENYPPYNASKTGENFAHNRGDIGGICTEMVEALMANTDHEYVMKMRDWSLAYDRVQTHENHALFCTARTEQREDDFQWVGPLASIRWTLFAAPDSDVQLDSLEDARDLTIAGYKGDVMTDYLINQGFNLTTSVTDEQNPRRLALGHVDLWVTDGLVGPLVAREEADVTGLRPVLVFRETPMYLAVSNSTDASVVADLQAGLDEAREEGAIDAIMKRYE